MQMKLVYWLEFGNLQENGSTVRQNMGRSNSQGIMARNSKMPRRKFRRTISRTVAVVPCLGEMTAYIAHHCPIHGQSEGNADTVLINMEPTRKHNGFTGVADALKAAVGHSI